MDIVSKLRAGALLRLGVGVAVTGPIPQAPYKAPKIEHEGRTTYSATQITEEFNGDTRAAYMHVMEKLKLPELHAKYPEIPKDRLDRWALKFASSFYDITLTDEAMGMNHKELSKKWENQTDYLYLILVANGGFSYLQANENITITIDEDEVMGLEHGLAKRVMGSLIARTRDVGKAFTGLMYHTPQDLAYKWELFHTNEPFQSGIAGNSTSTKNKWQEAVAPEPQLKISAVDKKEKSVESLTSCILKDQKFRFIPRAPLEKFARKYGQAYFSHLEKSLAVPQPENYRDLDGLRLRHRLKLDVLAKWNKNAADIIAELERSNLDSVSPAELVGAIVRESMRIGREEYNGAFLGTNGKHAMLSQTWSSDSPTRRGLR